MIRPAFFAWLVLIPFFLLFDGASWSSPAKRRGKASRKAKRKKANAIAWHKIFYSKRRFGRRRKSKRRGKWIKIKVLPIRSSLLKQFFGKRITIYCRLQPNELFECKGKSAQGTVVVEESARWPAGRLRIRLRIEKSGISMELSNRWRKHRWLRVKPRQRR